MSGLFAGIPLGIVIFLAAHYYLVQWDWVGDKLAIDALGVCLGLCGYYVARGVDVFLNQQRDNPQPFVVSKAVPEAFASIKEVFAESSYGPFFWAVKTVDPENNRLVATISFTELMGSGFVIPPIQAQRLVMVEVIADSVPEDQQKSLYVALPDSQEKGVTQIKISWRVDSPMNRFSVNRLMDECTTAIKESLGLPVPNKPQPRSPFLPPEWLIVLTVIAVVFCFQRAEEYGNLKIQRAAETKARQERLQQEQTRREEAERKYREYQEEQRRRADELWRRQQQGVPGSNPYVPMPTPQVNPFAPQLTPTPTNQSGGGSGTPWHSNFGGGN